MKTALFKLTSASPMTQSRKHDEPKKEKELPDAYEQRTWPLKAHVNGEGRITVPAFGLRMAILSAAKKSGDKIPGKKNATWTKPFMSGILIPEDIVTDRTKDDVIRTTINANADGVRGSGKRVTRHFPTLKEWSATVLIYVLDDIITKEVLVQYTEAAGKFVGVGQYRPENGGTNGRFSVQLLEWKE